MSRVLNKFADAYRNLNESILSETQLQEIGMGQQQQQQPVNQAAESTLESTDGSDISQAHRSAPGMDEEAKKIVKKLAELSPVNKFQFVGISPTYSKHQTDMRGPTDRKYVFSQEPNVFTYLEFVIETELDQKEQYTVPQQKREDYQQYQDHVKFADCYLRARFGKNESYIILGRVQVGSMDEVINTGIKQAFEDSKTSTFYRMFMAGGAVITRDV